MTASPLRRVLITGGSGLLGRTLLATAPPALELHATRHRAPVPGVPAHPLELAEEDAVLRLWKRLRPDLVIHTAYSIENAERNIWEATRNVVTACTTTGAALIHLSTDALFDGELAPYSEEAEPSPVHDYGRWKARAEAHVRARLPEAVVIRTSLITQLTPLDPRSAWIAAALRAGEPVTLFVDELRCPIGVGDLAQQIWEITSLPPAERAGVWHLAGPEAMSRYVLGLLIAAHERLDPAGITPALSAVSRVPRPRDVRLLTSRADRLLRTRARPIGALFLEGG